MENLFRFLLLSLIILFVIHRGYYYKLHSKSEKDVLKEQKEGFVAKIGIVLGTIGLASTITFTINPNWLSFANLHFPTWIRWAGVGLSITGFMLLQWAQYTLGKNWSGEPRMLKEQFLITSGPYQFIRHPIYTAFILILGSTLLISSNWLIGLCWLGMTSLEITSRITFEENLMLEFFGEQYSEYMKKTGRLFPKITD